MTDLTNKKDQYPRIIIIEDDDTVLDLIEGFLDDEGYEFISFNSINDDVRNEVQPDDIIIADVRINREWSAGVDFVLELKHKYTEFSDKNVIFMSDFGHNHVSQKLERLEGRYTWYDKPFDFLHLAKKIEEVKKSGKK